MFLYWPQRYRDLGDNANFLYFFGRKFCQFGKSPYLCSAKEVTPRSLGYGVMVTLQILVLPFLVRVRVAQQKRASHL